ncbi:MAG: hypothetical protein KF884_04880 [Fimbriimonadaceae bacterium]|nr:hypothetical protein [Fimbriimonadaceae bacterium]QYK59421.1 MAG: hypothetical protein KF884_04880 [Fimbriimonadaceae bacterium]
MAKIKIPTNETNFNVWFTNFQKKFATNYRNYGFTSNDVKIVNSFFKNWQNSLVAWNNFNQFVKVYTKFHNQEFATYQNFIQTIFTQIANNPNFNGNAQPWFGSAAPNNLPVKKTGATKSGSKTTKRSTGTSTRSTTSKTKSTTKKSTTKVGTKTGTLVARNTNGKLTNSVPAPFVWCTNGKGGYNVYVGSTKNGSFSLPTGANGALVEFKIGAGRWRRAVLGSNFPFGHNVSTGGKKIAYRACWTMSGGKRGPWSKPVTVSGNRTIAA